MPDRIAKRRNVRSLVAMVTLVLGLAACHESRPEASRPLVPQAPLRPVAPIVTESTSGVFRLVPEALRARHANPAPAINIDLGTIRAGEGIRLEQTGETLAAHGGEFDLLLEADTDIDLWRYTTLVFRAAVESGGTGQVSYTYDPKAASRVRIPTRHVPLVDDGAFHEYRVPLPDPAIARGSVIGMKIWFPGTPSVRITRLAFEEDAPPQAERLACEGQYRDVLFGSQPAWEVMVPERATFRAHLTYSHRGHEFDPVVCRVAVESEAGTRYVVGAKTLDADDRGRWVPITFGLEQFAGQRVRLHLEVDAAGRWESSGAVWGEPMVIPGIAPEKPVPVVLISLDTLRADHLGMYGYERATSPNLDAWSRETARFTNAVVYEPWTLTSHMTMLTGLHHERHRVNHTQNAPESVTMLAERLREEGYVTGGFVGHDYWLDPSRGFKRGFDVYGLPYPTIDFEGVDKTVDKAALWLRDQPSKKFFLFFHTYEIHSKFTTLGYTVPYAPSDASYAHFAREVTTPSYPDGPTDPIATDFLVAAAFGRVNVTAQHRAHMIASYDDTIRMVDTEVTRLLETLKSIGAYDDALIIVTADHGEEFGEKGYYLHSSLYEACVRVPLLVKFPGGDFAGTTCEHLVTNADFYPTVLDVLGLPPDPSLDGISLLSALEGRGEGHNQALLTFRPRNDGLRTPEWKLIHNFRDGRWELYNLVDDPAERTNVIGEAPGALPALQKELMRKLDMRPGWHIAIRGGATQQRVDITLESPDGVRSCMLQRSDHMGLARDALEVSGDGQRAHATLVIEPGDSDKMFFTGTGEIRAHIEDRNGQMVALHVGNAPVAEAPAHDMTLAAGDDRFRTIADAASDESAVVRVWYVPGAEAGGNTQPLADEDIERIESLGYLAP